VSLTSQHLHQQTRTIGLKQRPLQNASLTNIVFLHVQTVLFMISWFRSTSDYLKKLFNEL